MTVVVVGALTLTAGAIALATLWVPAPDVDVSALDEIPAAHAHPAVKLRLFYGALALDGLAMLVTSSDLPLYLTLLLVFAGVPILGHQSIGLTPARHRSAAAMRWWRLGWAFPFVTIGLGIALVLARLDHA
jgi:hypothetical protein